MAINVVYHAAIDNDVVLKLACFRMLGRLCEAMRIPPDRVLVLAAARFVLRSAIMRSRNIGDKEGTRACMEDFLATAQVIEPTPEEIAIATSIEEAALSRGLALDVGESQLCAVVLSRTIPVLATGDKRAVHALHALSEDDPRLAMMAGRVACLEQLALILIRLVGEAVFRQAVCAEREADKALAICCKCLVPESKESTEYSLRSYIDALRRNAPTLLISEYSS